MRKPKSKNKPVVVNPTKIDAALKTGKPLPPIPKYIGKIGKECWDRVVEILTDFQLLDGADDKAIEAFAAAYEEYRKAREVVMDEGFTYESFNKDGELKYIKRPEVDAMNNAWQRMKSLLHELCITPMARVKAGQKDTGAKVEEDPMKEFLE